MPHIIVMHSLGDAIETPQLLTKLHKTLCDFETVEPKSVKTFYMPVQECVVGTEEDPTDMIHIQVRMMPGRSEEMRLEMSQALHNLTRSFVDEKNIASTVSVEIHELDKPTYVSSH